MQARIDLLLGWQTARSPRRCRRDTPGAYRLRSRRRWLFNPRHDQVYLRSTITLARKHHRSGTMDDTQSESRTDDPVPASRSAKPPIGPTQTVATQDGRNLTYLEVGDPHGPLVIHNHGGPSSRFEARLFANSASKNRLRLICVDRPGIGQSSPQKARTYSGWADDLITIADALGYHEFGVTGWSEGGPWALAAAAYIDPLRLRHVSSIAGGSYGTFGDNWAADYLSKADALGGSLALRFKPGFRLMYRDPWHSRQTLPRDLRQTIAESRQRVPIDRFCFDRISKPPSAKHARNASLKVATG